MKTVLSSMQGALRSQLQLFKQRYLNGIPTMSERFVQPQRNVSVTSAQQSLATYDSLTGRLRDDSSCNESGSRVAREWLKIAATLLTIFVLGIGNAWSTPTSVIINIGTSTNYWDASEDATFTDSDSRSWSRTYSSNNSVTTNASYIQFGNGSNKCSNFEFKTTAGEAFTLKTFTVTIQGSNGGGTPSSGTIYLKLGTTTLESQSVSGTSSVTLSLSEEQSVSEDDELIVYYSGSKKGMRISQITYSYEATSPTPSNYTLYLVNTVSSCNTLGGYTSNQGTLGSGSGTWTGYKTYSGIAANTSVTITASAQSGYQFDGWTNGGYGIIMDESSDPVTLTSSTSTTATFSMPASDVYIYDCHFSSSTPAQTYDITYHTACGTNPNAASDVSSVTLPTISDCDCPQGWMFAGWCESTYSSSPSGHVLAAGSTYNPAADVDLYAVYQKSGLTNNTYSKFGNSTLSSGYYLISAFGIGAMTCNLNASNYLIPNTNVTGSISMTTDDVECVWYIKNNSTTFTIQSAANGKWLKDNGSGTFSFVNSEASATNWYLTVTGNTQNEHNYRFASSSGSTGDIAIGYANSLYKSGRNVTTNPSIMYLYSVSAGNVSTSYSCNPTCTQVYNVTYLANTDDTSVANMPSDNTDYANGANVSISSTTPTRTGYTFDKWFTDENCTTPAGGYAAGTSNAFAISANIVLYAHWTIHSNRLDVTSVDHITYTATPASGSAIAEGSYANVDYGKTVTLNYSSLDAGYTIEWDAYNTNTPATKVTITNATSNNATFTMPDYPVTVTVTVTPPYVYFTECDDDGCANKYCINSYKTGGNGMTCFTDQGSNVWTITNYAIPATGQSDRQSSKDFWVGYDGDFVDGKSANWMFRWTPFKTLSGVCDTYKLGIAAQAVGTLTINAATSGNNNNYELTFDPNGYGFCYGTDPSWQTPLAFTRVGVTNVWNTSKVNVSDVISHNYYVGISKSGGGYVFSSDYDYNDDNEHIKGISQIQTISGVPVVSNSTSNPVTFRGSNLSSTDGANGMRGYFQIWTDNCNRNFYCHFVPVYTITYKSYDGSSTLYTVEVSAGESFTVRAAETGSNGWAESASQSSASSNYTVGNSYTPTGDVTLYVAMTTYTVTYVHHDKGTFSGASTTQYVPASSTTITLPTVSDVSCGLYDTFVGWIASASEYAESTTAPGSILAGGSSYTVSGDVTLRAVYSKCLGDQAYIYSKVTSAPTDWTGTYLIVHEGSGKVMNGNETQANLTTTSNNVAVEIVNSKVASNSTTDTYTFTIAPHSTASGKYSIRSHSGYYIGSNSTSAAINATTTETTYANSISLTNETLMIGCGTKNSNDKDFQLMFKSSGSGSPIFKYFASSESPVCLYEKQSLCTTYYATNPTCTLPAGVHINYDANDNDDATGTCSTQNRTYDATNGYPKLASTLDFCTNVTREGYTLVGWNTRADGLGTTYNVNQHYYNLPITGALDGENYLTLNLYAMWAPSVKFNLGNASGGTGVPDAIKENGSCALPTPTAAHLGTIPCGYEFYGWSESSVASTTTAPTILTGDTYSGSNNVLYAVYRLGEAGSNPDLFSLSYTYSDTKYYIGIPDGISSAPSEWATEKVKKFSATTDAEEALAFGKKSIDGKTIKTLYWMYGEEEVYVYWLDNSGSLTHAATEDTDYGWTISGTTDLSFSTTYSNKDPRQIVFTAASYGDPATFNASTNAATSLHVEEASSTVYTYATSPTCYTTATLSFVTNSGTLNYPTSYTSANYEDLTIGTEVLLPTATFAGEWTFEGWMKGSEVTSTPLKPESANFIEVTLNTTTYEATETGTTTFYAVYSKTVDDKQFDPVNGGTYKLFAILSDGTTKKYMPTWGGTQTTLTSVTTCAETGEYTITPGTGVHAGQYKITHGDYTLGVKSDADTQFKNDADAWWNIDYSTSGKGTYRITIVGSTHRCMSLGGGGTGSFGNYTRNDVSSPGQSSYRDMEIGECIYTEYTSTPANIPYITITGNPIKITSTKGERIYSPTTLHVEAHNFSGALTLHFEATNGFSAVPATDNCDAHGAYSGDIQIYYQPSTDGDGSITSSVLTVDQRAGTVAEQISQTFTAIKGRNMPQDFVIAVKSGTQWYALPDDCHGSGTPTAVPIEVNNASAPTAASLVPHNTEWRLKQVVGAQSSGSRPKDKIYFYEPNAIKTEDPPVYWNYALKALSAPNIGTEAQVANIGSASSAPYEWGLTTSDLCAYTISNADVNKNISINESGNFGTHGTNVVSDVLYLLPITAYYETAKMQVLEWKANSVVVMYTGSQTTATTKVGDNTASGAQTLASQKLTHGIYELATSQALTENSGSVLKVSFGGGAEMILVEIPIIINSAVTASESHESQDVIITKTGKLTAAATKYSFRNIYVYGGGKLKIATGTQLGVNNIILRAGGISTNGTGGSVTYEYIYPQVELGGTLSSTKTDIKYEYITDYTHWYQFCLPFDGTYSTITYPQEYYGDNVTAANTGSWIIKRYAGEIRATGNYNAWVDIEDEWEEGDPKTVKAGQGYLYWGAPKKIKVGNTSERSAWGIQRITMSIAASAATTAETANKNVTVHSYSEQATSTKPNDQGWNLVGNPYMVNLTGLNSTSLIAGELVHSQTTPWDGKWINNGTGTRYVTVPDEHFDNYQARPMSWFTAENPMINGKVFFVQIAEDENAENDNITLTFDVDKRASLMQALRRNEAAVDIETGIVMNNGSLKDEVNFWIKDGKTAEYEFNADYPKTPNATNFNIYGVHSHGDLSWIAISPEIAEGSMAIGYQVPAAGNYTLSLSETYVSEDIEALYVTDHGVSPEVTTNLVDDDYVFTVNQAETNNVRFTISIKLKEEQQTPTDIEGEVLDNPDMPQKFIYHDKMYIYRNGVIYDAVGKKVK